VGATPEELKAQIDQTRTELSADVDTLADRVNPASIARRRTASARNAAGQVRSSVMGSVAAASDTATSAPGALSGKAKGNPLAAGLIAFGAGLLLSSLVPTTGTEEELGAAVMDAAEPAKQAAREQLDQAKEALVPAAQEAAQHVKDTATDAAQATTEQAKGAASDTAAHVSHAAENVRQGS
jgi:hypothetical protein